MLCEALGAVNSWMSGGYWRKIDIYTCCKGEPVQVQRNVCMRMYYTSTIQRE